jgi:hypothetical protein
VANLIVIDEDCSTRLPAELVKRGRQATSVQRLGLKGLDDSPLLRALDKALKKPWVLFTGDDTMPYEHAETIAVLGATIATIDGEHKRICASKSIAMGQEEWRHETLHRWAHVIAVQKPGAVRRYSPFQHRLWTPRAKHVHRVSAKGS